VTATNYLEQKIVDHVLGTTSFTMPTNVFVKLHTADPGEDATTAPAGNTSRQDVNFGAASNPGGSALNSSVPAWVDVSTAETYTHFSIWDTVGPTGGNPLLTGALTVSVTVAVNDDVSFPVGSLSVTCT
jgi:hypothetical protein